MDSIRDQMNEWIYEMNELDEITLSYDILVSRSNFSGKNDVSFMTHEQYHKWIINEIRVWKISYFWIIINLWQVKTSLQCMLQSWTTFYPFKGLFFNNQSINITYSLMTNKNITKADNFIKKLHGHDGQ